MAPGWWWVKPKNWNRKEVESSIEPEGKLKSRVWKASKVGQELVSTLGPHGQVKFGIQGLSKGNSYWTKLRLLMGNRRYLLFCSTWVSAEHEELRTHRRCWWPIRRLEVKPAPRWGKTNQQGFLQVSSVSVWTGNRLHIHKGLIQNNLTKGQFWMCWQDGRKWTGETL